MVRRQTRHKSMTDTERERFLQEATQAHDRLGPCLTALSPLSNDYKADLRLDDDVQKSIRDLSGDDSPWCKVQPDNYPGERTAQRRVLACQTHTIGNADIVRTRKWTLP